MGTTRSLARPTNPPLAAASARGLPLGTALLRGWRTPGGAGRCVGQERHPATLPLPPAPSVLWVSRNPGARRQLSPAQIPPSLLPDFFQTSPLHWEPLGFPRKHETSHSHAHSVGAHSLGTHSVSRPNREKRFRKATGLHGHVEPVWAAAGKAPVLAATLRQLSSQGTRCQFRCALALLHAPAAHSACCSRKSPLAFFCHFRK